MDGWLSINDLITLIYFLAPAYAANSTPVVFSGHRPIDLGKMFLDGERILGSHKTIKGTVGGLLSGSLVSIAEYMLIPMYHPIFGLVVTGGAVLGDLFGAFIKRRVKIRPGDPAPLLDQLDFIFVAALFSCLIWGFSLKIAVIAILITPPIHLIANIIAYMFGLKDNYW